MPLSPRGWTGSSRSIGRSSRMRAVLGLSFTADALADLSGTDRDRLDDRLAGLVTARAPADRRRPALARARPVPVRPGGHPRGRLQHADEARATGAPPRRRPVLRDDRRRGAGQHPRLPLPRRLPQRDGRGRGRHARRPGPGGAPRRGGSGDPASLVRPGDVVLHPGPGGDRRSRRADHAQGAGRGGGELRRALRRGDAPARGGCRRTSGCRRPARRRASHGRVGVRDADRRPGGRSVDPADAAPGRGRSAPRSSRRPGDRHDRAPS